MQYYSNNEGVNLQDFPEEFYLEMKNSIASLDSIDNEDPRDFTLFYGLWWKYAYTDGIPSSAMIFNDLGITAANFSALDLYEKAKIGGEQIELKWIRRERTLRFRTLLLQGGIPLKTLGAYGTDIYKNFLLKVIELKPERPEEIANNVDIIRYLPMSNRNEVFFEIAFKISQAIWEANEEGLKILDVLNANNQSELVNDLISKKDEIKRRFESQLKIKSFWELSKSDFGGDYKINLIVELPERMEKDRLADFLHIQEDELSTSYNFFCEDSLLCTYRKNIKGNYLKVSSFKPAINWDLQNDQIPILYFSDDSGKKYLIPQQINKIPSADYPTFWIPMDENRWLMSNKLSYSGDSVFVLTNQERHCGDNFIPVSISNIELYFFEIQATTEFKIAEDEIIEFKLNTQSFDWYIQSAMPSWMERANKLIVKAKPQVHFFDQTGNLIPDSQFEKRWRKKGEIEWNSFQQPFSSGIIIELEFKHSSGAIEYEQVYHIGNSNLSVNYLSLLAQKVNFSHENLRLRLLPNELYSEETTELNPNEKVLKFSDPKHIPKRIKAVLTNQFGTLRFLFALNIRGIEIFDSRENCIEDKHVFLLNNLYGYRIVNGESRDIKIYNQQYPELVICQTIQAGIIPLRNYQLLIQKLFLLADSMSTNNVVVMQMGGKIYNFQLYNADILFRSTDGVINFTADNRLQVTSEKLLIEESTISAIPLNCELNSISTIVLEKNETGFSFPSGIEEEEFIVFDTNIESSFKILPTYVTSNPEKLESDSERLYQNKLNRIENFALSLNEQLFSEADWRKLNKYIQLCIEHDLPFSAFDIIRASSSSTDLTAKLLCSLIMNSVNKDEFIRTCVKMEEELGFKFHWCSFESIEDEISSILELIGFEKLGFIMERVSLIMRLHYFQVTHPEWRKQLAPIIPTINQMRRNLGEAVINELPRKYPWISDQRKKIIQLNDPNVSNRLKIMFRVPITVALLKLNLYKNELPTTGNVSDLWHLNNHEVRRNMMYCENLDPTWYDFAISYAKRIILN
ncbi:hypothetical protein SKC37_10250 [Aquirufa sp. HETE-83D]|uniref:Uncharacterized protein n=1 Tax=Aquirufa esocilacus TaxID=3096513 RepID=A0ABW6DNC0_9BACT